MSQAAEHTPTVSTPASATPKRSAIIRTSELVEAIWVTASRIVLLVLLGTLIFKIMSPPIIVIDDTTSDKQPGALTRTAELIPAQIIHHLDEISYRAKTDNKRKLESHLAETFDIRVSSVGVSANSLLSYVRSAVGNSDYHIHSYLEGTADDFSLVIWGAPDRRALDYTIRAKSNSGEIAIEAAENIEKAVDPLLLASYYFSSESSAQDKKHGRSLGLVIEITDIKSQINVTDEDKARAFNIWGLILLDKNSINSITEAMTKYEAAVSWSTRKQQPRRFWPLWRLTEPAGHVAALAYANWGDAFRRLSKLEAAIEKYRSSGLWRDQFYGPRKEVFREWDEVDKMDYSRKEARLQRYWSDLEDKSSNHFFTYLNLARVTTLLGNNEEAQNYMNNALSIESEIPDELIAASHVLYFMGRYQEAKEQIQHALNQSDSDVDSWALSAEINIKLGLIEEAETEAKRAIDLLHPENREFFY